MRKYSTDYPLWAVVAGALFGIAVVVRVTDRPIADLGHFVVDMAFLWVACAVVGWVFQAVAVVCGVRFPRFTAPPDGADYDDEPPAD